MAQNYTMTVPREVYDDIERVRLAQARLSGEPRIIPRKEAVPLALKIAAEAMEAKVEAMEAAKRS